MRNPYYCPHCDHRSTRRWNLDVHIKRKHGGYLLNKSLDHMPNNPPLYSNSVRLGHPILADSIDNSFHPKFLPQEMPLATSQYSAYPALDVRQTFVNPPMQIMNHQNYVAGSSPETILKIAELKPLVNKYPQFHTIDADEIVKWAIYCSSNRDNKFLDDMLDQLRTIDSLANIKF